MKCARNVLAFVLVVFFAALISAQEGQIASDSELAAITARGKLLYEYDQAAWHASDAVMATHPPEALLGRYIAKKTDAGWVVAFGHLNDAKDAFMIAATATQGKSLQEFSVKRIDPPQADRGFFLSASAALDAAVPAFHGAAANRTYNAAVLPAPAGRWYVYLEPAQTDADGDYFPLGADVRYLVSADGLSIVETRQMHQSIIPKAEIPPGTKLAAGFHTHVLSDVPEDSDVFCVLSRKPSMPEYVGSKTAVYVVNTDGSIQFVERLKKHR
jgi:hypothetical protein